MAQQTKDLRLNVSGTETPQEWILNSIPVDIWNQFKEKAKSYFPDKGEEAWSSYIAEIVASLCDGETYTLLMADIPSIAKDRLQNVCAGASMSFHQVIAMLFLKGGQDKLHLIRMTGTDVEGTQLWKEEEGHWIVMANVSPKSWASWSEAAERLSEQLQDLHGIQLGPTPQSLFGFLLQQMEDGQLNLGLQEGLRVEGPSLRQSDEERVAPNVSLH